MAGLNMCQYIGNLGGDPEMHYTSSGRPVSTFNLACNRSFNNGAGVRQEETEWVSVKVWNKLAEQCNQFLLKGSQVYVEGRWHSHAWDAPDGQKQRRVEVIASQVVFLSPQNGFRPEIESQREEL